MSYNLGDKSPEEREKINVDLAASGVWHTRNHTRNE
ncbi:DNA polymerase III, theta subunit [Serratia liquefaciens]|nr:DNA polymerase III, theta subunit [Serratia liquefaciens]